VEGKKSKEAVTVYSYEALLWRSMYGDEPYPDYFVTTEDLTPDEHIRVQAAAQEWIDSSISKTINVPTDISFEDFKEVYLKAYRAGCKGVSTFRFNPEAFQGVLVKADDLAATRYRFTTESGEVHEFAGNEVIMYEGEEHTAANLFDAIKEKTYGRM
jgi:ribonucleoside-diphosphate reductase alpha chain